MRAGEEAAILVTGAAGLIGHHLNERLLRECRRVVGADSFDPYYDLDDAVEALSRLIDCPPARNPDRQGGTAPCADASLMMEVRWSKAE
jgi:nucleoside-diphosphate-sugar epimerase